MRDEMDEDGNMPAPLEQRFFKKFITRDNFQDSINDFVFDFMIKNVLGDREADKEMIEFFRNTSKPNITQESFNDYCDEFQLQIYDFNNPLFAMKEDLVEQFTRSIFGSKVKPVVSANVVSAHAIPIQSSPEQPALNKSMRSSSFVIACDTIAPGIIGPQKTIAKKK